MKLWKKIVGIIVFMLAAGGLVFGSAVTDFITVSGDLVVDTDVLVVNATTDRVGIGTATPGYPLDVSGNIGTSGSFRMSSATPYFQFDTNNAGAHIYAPNGDDSSLNITVGGYTAFNVYDSAWTEIMRVNENGVGIGTTSPLRKLEVESGASDTAMRIESSDANALLEFVDGSSDAAFVGLTDGNFTVAINGEKFRVQRDGNVGIGTTSPEEELTISSAGGATRALIQRDDDTIVDSNTLGTLWFGATGSWGDAFDTAYITAIARDTYTAANQGSELQFWTTSSGSAAPTQRLTIEEGGNVGIGTASPKSELDVLSSANSEVSITGGTNNDAHVWFYQNTDIRALIGYDDSESALRMGVTGVANALNIKDTTGYVGIGTSTPSAKLDIKETGTDYAFEIDNDGSKLDIKIEGGNTKSCVAGEYGLFMNRTTGDLIWCKNGVQITLN